MDKILKKGSETKNQYFENLINSKIFPPTTPQDIDREKVQTALEIFDRSEKDIIDVVMALLDNKLPSLFKTPEDVKFSDGASIADIGCYVGIWQRRGNKLDREGRDYWIKPLREIGIIEPIEWNTNLKEFLIGHLTPKSPNAAYRLDDEFVNILQLDIEHMKQSLKEYKKDNNVASRLKKQAELIQISKNLVGSGSHESLIHSSINVYAPHFLPDYEVCFKDDSDGDRVTQLELDKLNSCGIKLGIGDSWPDVILFNPKENKLWFVEAVTSDGEVDQHKLKGLFHICEKSNKEFGGATTTYKTWSDFSKRQKTFKNLAMKSYVWIEEDPVKVFYVDDCHT